MKRMLAGALALAVVAVTAMAGTETNDRQHGLGRAALPEPERTYGIPAGFWGVQADLGWAFLDWELGPLSGSDRAFVPRVGLSFRTAESWNVLLSVLHASGKDRQGALGVTQASMTKISLGARYWTPGQGRVAPFLGGGVGYALLDADADFVPLSSDPGAVEPAVVSGVKDMPGAHVEGGVAFRVNDLLFLQAGATYDFLLGSGDVAINGHTRRMDFQSFSVSVGVLRLF